ncbi:uncharacterized protein SPPG_00570 [Spizellomyces punctatus DAOM BR117]|uniref:Ribosomal protein L22 n=1 Tax=Spizellomyces punctatus (strain DAOM BR117) TaxID=645134 RepID=A0A0L0HUU5_SPIPD|nr:uncharacterized protein SPPG_00570 [Spizellomyces punctatus DAOM BR117]KND04872.1 hypothetical protein SPPG_00570 [Spizellomyces punctatus DAOM BR117]|eukprot:XP_016612911.1 hypothetical protein SPPG_00570 [Spizellomyces punctatus DAOM BR117]
MLATALRRRAILPVVPAPSGLGRPAACARRATLRFSSTTPAAPKPQAAASSLFQAAKEDAESTGAVSGTTSSEDATVPTPSKATDKAIPTFTTGDFRVSPRKLLHLARLIRGMPLLEAEVQMKMSKKRPADRVRAMLHRAASALQHNYGKDPKSYIVQQAWVGKGTYLKRLKIHGKARFGVMHRPAGHVKIILAEKKMDKTKQEKDFDKLVDMFKRHNLYIPLRDSEPVRFLHPPWSRKPWKYVTSPKWVDPKNALARDR